jgi:hypothetical protein
MSAVLAAFAIALGALALAHGAAWLALSLLALKRPLQPSAAPALRFAVIVPAHNEEQSVAAAVASLRADRYEPEPVILVVADNCTDATAERAAAAGARVLTRRDEANRGKSFALDAGIAWLERSGADFDIYVVVDADTTVEPGFFAGLAVEFARGAEIAQAHYAVAPSTQPLPRLRGLAFVLVHYARPLGAKRLGLGMGLKGNGMAFTRALVADGIPGTGIAEDASATLVFARLGVGATLAPGATVRGAMASRYRDAAAQDRRWEGGRLALAPRALAVAIGALVRGRLGAAGAAFDIAALPLTAVLLAGWVSLAVAVAGPGPAWLPSLALGLAGASVVTGFAAAHVPARELIVLVHAPGFLLHKLLVLGGLVVRGAPRAWERTARETETRC